MVVINFGRKNYNKNQWLNNQLIEQRNLGVTLGHKLNTRAHVKYILK